MVLETIVDLCKAGREVAYFVAEDMKESYGLGKDVIDVFYDVRLQGWEDPSKIPEDSTLGRNLEDVGQRADAVYGKNLLSKCSFLAPIVVHPRKFREGLLHYRLNLG